MGSSAFLDQIQLILYVKAHRLIARVGYAGLVLSLGQRIIAWCNKTRIKKRSYSKYSSPEIQNEIIHIMARQL